MRAFGHGVIFATLITLLTTADSAALTAASADDICAPTVDPCVISAIYDVTGPLDFGLRAVRISAGGRLRGQPHVILGSGSLIIDAGSATSASVEATSGNLTITAYRACSGDSGTRCLTDAMCAGSGLGTCSLGAGSVTTNGKITGAGANPGLATIHAAGDISIGERVNFGATGAAHDGGSVDIESFGGSVVVTASGDVLARSSEVGAYGYYGGEAGDVTLRAATDITIGGSIDVWGRLGGGDATIESGRDVMVNSDILSNGGGGYGANGGRVHVTAGRDIVLASAAGGDTTQSIEADGGSAFYFYGYGSSGGWYSGYGGYQYLTAGEDIAVSATGSVRANGGKAAGGGKIYMDALGRVDIDGEIRAQGTPPNQGADSGAGGGSIFLSAGQGIRLASGAILATASPVWGGGVHLQADGPVELYGTVDVRGNGLATYGGQNYSQGGYFDLEGSADVSLGGAILGGGPGGTRDMTVDVCRLGLLAGARIENAFRPPAPWAGDVRISVHESMTTDADSEIESDMVAGGRNVIAYRDEDKPPTLDGVLLPLPLLSVQPSLVGCPVCGNGEIDQGESCDDGNIVSGDGCRDDCQDEGCIAESPGFPGTPLCQDADPCTLDDCDPVAHACTHVLSCEEGVACTDDACVAGGCVHTPSDALCDDRNDCTDDLCNATTGCVHANLTGGTCEDGDICTTTGTCQWGNCVASDRAYSSVDDIRIKLKAGTANDSMKLRASIPLSYLDANPTVTGLRVLVVDASDEIIYDAQLGATDWQDRTGRVVSFRFRDSQGVAGPANGVRSATLKHDPKLAVAKLKLSMKGAEIPGAADQVVLSVSYLFGTDPAADDCVTARRITCLAASTKVACKR